MKKTAESFALSFFLLIFADVLHINRRGSMTTIELRTSITADLDLLSAEMLENVSRYVKRLTRHSRNAGIERQKASKKMEDAMSFVKTPSVIGEQKVPGDERGIDVDADCIVTRNKKDFHKSTIPVFTTTEFFNQTDKSLT